MSELTAQVMDQRCAERIAIGENVEFRCNSDEDFRLAKMVDFSETGMLLIMKEKYEENAKFEVRVKEDESIYFSVQCVRTSTCSDADFYGYGCKIKDHRIEE